MKQPGEIDRQEAYTVAIQVDCCRKSDHVIHRDQFDLRRLNKAIFARCKYFVSGKLMHMVVKFQQIGTNR